MLLEGIEEVGLMWEDSAAGDVGGGEGCVVGHGPELVWFEMQG